LHKIWISYCIYLKKSVFEVKFGKSICDIDNTTAFFENLDRA